jgi:hypothetical protein
MTKRSQNCIRVNKTTGAKMILTGFIHIQIEFFSNRLILQN